MVRTDVVLGTEAAYEAVLEHAPGNFPGTEATCQAVLSHIPGKLPGTFDALYLALPGFAVGNTFGWLPPCYHCLRVRAYRTMLMLPETEKCLPEAFRKQNWPVEWFYSTRPEHIRKIRVLFILH